VPESIAVFRCSAELASIQKITIEERYRDANIRDVKQPGPKMVHYLCAYGLAGLLLALGRFVFHRTMPPRYGDLFLPGVALICARYSWRSAAILFAFSYLALALLVLPLAPGRLPGFGIYGGTGVMMIWIVNLAKGTRKP